MRPLGIFGGTFDPIHFGHLRSAFELRQALELQQVRLIPCGIPPHREPPVAAGSHRLAMLQTAVDGVRGLAVDDRELKRTGPSYTADTLLSLRQDYPQTPLCLIMGADAFASLNRWYRWETLLENAHIIVAFRPGVPLPERGPVAEALAARRVTSGSELRRDAAGAILPWQVTQLEISSSEIRAMVGKGQSPRFLMPESVWELIRRRRLYHDQQKEHN